MFVKSLGILHNKFDQITPPQFFPDTVQVLYVSKVQHLELC